MRSYGLTVAQVYQKIAADLTTTTTAKTPVVVDGTSMTVQITDNLDPVTKENMMNITFDTSILPYEDCCTVFTPRHPRTKPNLEEVREAEAALDIEGLIDRAMANREFVRIKF